MIMDSSFLMLTLLASISGSQDVVPGSAVAAASVNFLNSKAQVPFPRHSASEHLGIVPKSLF